MCEPKLLLLPRVSLALTAASIGILLLSHVVEGQTSAPCRRATAFGASELLDALASGAAPAAVARLTVNCGTSFSLTAELEERFRMAGADNGLLAAVRKMSPSVGAAAGTRWLSPVDGSEMIAVGTGIFQMGSPPTEPGRDPDELQHYQEIPSAMWVDTTEVTYAAFRRFVLAVPNWQKGRPSSDLVDSNYLMDWNGTEFPADRGDEPVTWVSWHAARAYAMWAGKRLPTEVEWEYLARSSTTGRYWWGDTFDRQRVRGGSSDVRIRRGPWGLQDMLGSVWEWVSTFYAEYPYNSSKEDVEAAGRRVIRGGAMNSGEQFVRAANRSAELPTLTSDQIGFRCVR